MTPRGLGLDARRGRWARGARGLGLVAGSLGLLLLAHASPLAPAARADDGRWSIAARAEDARALAARGERDAALAALDLLVDERPRALEPRLQRALLLLEGGDAERAARDAAILVAARPEDDRVLFLCGHARADACDLVAARADYANALRLRPRARNDLWSRGSDRFERGDWDGAVIDFTDALALGPTAELHVARASALYARRDFAPALADLEQALAADPDYAYAYTLRGNLHASLGDLERALACFDEATTRAASGRAPLLSRACVEAALGRDDAAAATLARLIARDATRYGELSQRGFARWMTGDLAGAKADYGAALKARPQHASARVGRGLLLALDGDLAGAAADLRAAYRAAPERGYAAVWLAVLARERGPAEAVAFGPDWSHDLATYAIGRRSADDLLAEARRAASEVEARERLCEAWAYLGAAAEQRGEVEAACDAYRSAVDTGIRYYYEWLWASGRLERLRPGEKR